MKKSIQDKDLNDIKENQNIVHSNLDEKTEDEKIKELEKLVGNSAEVTPQQRKKKLLIRVFFICFNVIAILLVLAYENIADSDVVSFSVFINALKTGYPYLIIAIGVYLLHLATEGFIFFTLIKESGYGSRYGLGFKVATLGRYYDNLTPWATGGQPFQMLYLYKHGIDLGTACSLPLVKFTIRVFVVNIAILLLYIFGNVTGQVNTVIVVAAFVAVAFNFVLPVALVVFTINKEWGEKVVRLLVKLAYRIKFVKDFDKTLNKYTRYINDFLSASKYLSRHQKLLVIVAVLSLVFLFAIHSIPYFVIKSLGYQDVNILQIIILTLFTLQAASYVPTPGAAGAAEGIFYVIFASIVKGGYIFWAVLLWRLIVYYLPILIGICIQILDAIKGKKPLKRLNKMDWHRNK